MKSDKRASRIGPSRVHMTVTSEHRQAGRCRVVTFTMSPDKEQSPTASSESSGTASNKATNWEMGPIRGLEPHRTFANDDDLINEIVAQVTEAARANGIYDVDCKPSSDGMKWPKNVSGKAFLSEAFLKTYLQRILQTRSLPLVAALAMATSAAKLVADEKNQANIVRIGKHFTPLGQDGKELLDTHGLAFDCHFSNDPMHNKARITAGGVGTFVKFWKVEAMKQWGDFTDGTFVSTAAGPVICKCYTGVVSAVGQETVEINAFETVRGRGFTGIPADRTRYYVALVGEGVEYPVKTAVDSTQEDKVFFTRDHPNRASGLLNLVPVVVRYEQMLAPAQGRLTNESLVRFSDEMQRVCPLLHIRTLPCHRS